MNAVLLVLALSSVHVPTPPAVVTPSINLELAVFAALQASDVASTHAAIRSGGVEANPVMRWAADSVPQLLLVKGGLTFAIVKGMQAICRRGVSMCRAAKVTLWVVNVGMAAVVVNNLSVVQQRRSR